MKKILSKVVVLIVVFAVIAGLFLVAVNKTKQAHMPTHSFELFDKGVNIVDYSKYGQFQNEGTQNYRFVVKDKKGLAEAVGEGIFPNNSVYKDPVYKQLQKDNKLSGSHWDYMYPKDKKLAFYKWATASEDPGVKLFYTALALENAGLINQAIKAYYAVLVHYPKTISFTYWNTPWYPSKTAVAKILYLTRKYPFLGMKLEGARIVIENGYNLDPLDDKFIVSPGKLIKCKPAELLPEQNKARLVQVEQQIGYADVNLLNYKSGDWQFIVKGKPFMVKAVAYTPAKLGQSPDEGSLADWMHEDNNNNNKIDGAYDVWVDLNKNNKQDPGEKPVGDFELMNIMGVNTLRVYDHKTNSNKELLRELHKKYGLMVIMGDFLGAYAVGSGTSWYRGTKYSSEEHQNNMKARVKEMIEEYKDEPYVLMWMLGNENNYGVANSARRYPEAYFKFVNDVAKMIKEIDTEHPVAICNGDTLFLDLFAEYCKDVDIYGANSYRGEQGFGFWDEVKDLTGKPVVITEYGASAYWEGHSLEEAEQAQSDYLIGAWEDMLYNSAGYGYGNAIGGVLFEWVDEWWKAYEPMLHDTHKQWPGPMKGGWVFEEWFGITSQGDGTNSPFMRQIRKAYYTYKILWNPNFYDKMKKIWYNIVVNIG